MEGFKGKANLNGRPKGAENSTTKVAKEFILKIVNDNLETIQNDFKQLQPKDRIKLTIDLMAFVIPKLRQVDATIESNNTENNELINKLLSISDADFNKIYENE
ncbi:MAG: hypothetical protein HQ490_00295 [Lutibacter sp.]|nr:hypothetical protein [Lutibacter sp.]